MVSTFLTPMLLAKSCDSRRAAGSNGFGRRSTGSGVAVWWLPSRRGVSVAFISGFPILTVSAFLEGVKQGLAQGGLLPEQARLDARASLKPPPVEEFGAFFRPAPNRPARADRWASVSPAERGRRGCKSLATSRTWSTWNTTVAPSVPSWQTVTNGSAMILVATAPALLVDAASSGAAEWEKVTGRAGDDHPPRVGRLRTLFGLDPPRGRTGLVGRCRADQYAEGASCRDGQVGLQCVVT